MINSTTLNSNNKWFWYGPLVALTLFSLSQVGGCEGGGDPWEEQRQNPRREMLHQTQGRNPNETRTQE